MRGPNRAEIRSRSGNCRRLTHELRNESAEVNTMLKVERILIELRRNTINSGEVFNGDWHSDAI